VRRAVLVALLASLAVAVSAPAHGNEPVFPDAVDALRQGPIYVDYDAKPTLTELEADQLGARLAARHDVFVAVLPASVAEEVPTNPAGIAAALGEKVDRRGTYVVSVGGRLGAWTNALAPEHLPLFIASTHGSLDTRLTAIAARLPEAPPEDDENWTAFAIAAIVILALAVTVLVAVRRTRLERIRSRG
jgi:hypothetical protein